MTTSTMVTIVTMFLNVNYVNMGKRWLPLATMRKMVTNGNDTKWVING